MYNILKILLLSIMGLSSLAYSSELVMICLQDNKWIVGGRILEADRGHAIKVYADEFNKDITKLAGVHLEETEEGKVFRTHDNPKIKRMHNGNISIDFGSTIKGVVVTKDEKGNEKSYDGHQVISFSQDALAPVSEYGLNDKRFYEDYYTDKLGYKLLKRAKEYQNYQYRGMLQTLYKTKKGTKSASFSFLACKLAWP